MKFSINKIKEYLVAILVAVFLSLALFYPALPHLSSSFIGDGGDNYEYASYMMLFKQNIMTAHFPLASSNFWRYPVGFEFDRAFDSHIAVFLGGTLNLLIPSPLSYNLTVLILVFLNGLLSYIFFRFLTGSKALGILGMVIYGFSFYTLARAEAHLNLLFIGAFPLLAYSVLKIVRNPQITKKSLFLFFFSYLLLALGSKQYFILGTLFLFLYTFITLIFYKETFKLVVNKIREAYRIFLISLLCFISVISFIFFPVILAIINGTFYVSNRDTTLFMSTPGVSDFFVPNSYLQVISNLVKSHSMPSIEAVVFMGWIELLIFILFFLSRQIKIRFKLFVAVLFLVPFIFALGYGKANHFPLLPYRFLQNIFIFKVLAETGRYFVIFELIVASVVTLSLVPLKKNKRVFPVLITIIILLTLLERMPTKILMAPTLNDEYTKVISRENSKAVLDLPVNVYFSNYNVLSFYYQKPIVNGYFHWSADGSPEREFLISSSLLQRFACYPNDKAPSDNSELFNNLKAQGITTIVIHKDYDFYYDKCNAVRERLSKLIPNISIAVETNAQKEITQAVFRGNPKFSLYFPKSGKVNLDGVYIAPDSKANFNIELNGAPLQTDYSWHPVGSPNAMEVFPKNQIELDVDKGSTLTFYSNDLVNYTLFSVWYRYQAEGNDSVPLTQPVQVIYNNDQAEILRLN